MVASLFNCIFAAKNNTFILLWIQKAGRKQVVFNPVCQYGYTVFEGCYHIFCTFAVPKMRKK